MANQNNNPDLVYLKSRDDLLLYEDARLNSMLLSVANFYITRNDQSVWGNFLRALAIELAKIDYSYSYDLVNKDPSFLTPSDVDRRWAAPLYVSSNWPSPQQSDIQYKQMLVQLIQAYQMGTTIEAIQNVILAYTGIEIKVIELYKLIGDGVYDQSDRNTINVSVRVGNAGSNPLTTVTSLVQLQTIIQSLYNAVALATPAHVGLYFTTIFSEGEDLDCILSPEYLTLQQYFLMPQAQQGYYTTIGYVPISPALFWKKSTPFVLGNVLRDYNGNFQLLTSLGAFPNQSGVTVPTWNITSLENTTDENFTWENISPAVLSTSVNNDVLTVNLSYPVGLVAGSVVKLINLTNATWLNKISLTVVNVSGSSFTANFTYSNYSLTEPTGTATFALPYFVTAYQWKQLNSTWQTLYQLQYQNKNCQSNGINDILRIFIRQIEAEPIGPMLIQAPVLNPANPKTTIAAYGRLLSPSLTPSEWLSLPLIYVNLVNGMANGTDAIYSYVPINQMLHEGEILTITGFPTAALNVTAQIRSVINLAAIINATSVTDEIVTIYAPNSFTSGQLVTFSGLNYAAFLNGRSLVIQTANPTSFTVNATHVNYSSTMDAGNAEVSTFQIPLAETIMLETPNPTAKSGLVTPTLQSAYYLSKGNYVLGQPALALTGAGIGSSWVPNGNVFQGQVIVDSNGNTQLALNSGVSGSTKPSWSLVSNTPTSDGAVNWRKVFTFSAPNSWVGILNFNGQSTPAPFTGEVGNWDPNHMYGLLAPRISSTWEVSGGDSLEIIGLY